MFNPERDEEILIEQIENEIRKIYTSVEKLYNNRSINESNDPVEKSMITNYCLSSCLLKKGIDDEINQSGPELKMFRENLQQELDFLVNDFDHILKKMNEYKDVCSSIDSNMEILKTIMEANDEQAPQNKNLNDVTKNIKLRFKKEKADLKNIITTLFADNLDVQDLIARIIEHHFNEGCDKYLQLDNTDNTREQIELLRRTNLFEVNPHDVLQIRLADLI